MTNILQVPVLTLNIFNYVAIDLFCNVSSIIPAYKHNSCIEKKSEVKNARNVVDCTNLAMEIIISTRTAVWFIEYNPLVEYCPELNDTYFLKLHPITLH